MTIEQTYREMALSHLAALRESAKEAGITDQQIADRAGMTRSNVQRVLAGKYIPRYDNYLRLNCAVSSIILEK